MNMILLLVLSQSPAQDATLTLYSYRKPIFKTHTWVVVTFGNQNVCISWFCKSREGGLFTSVEPGILFSHEDSMENARLQGVVPLKWGPVRVRPEFFYLAKKQEARLNSGKVGYKFLDKKVRHRACNCIHAVADIDTTQPVLYTGTARGIQAGNILWRHFGKWMLR